MKRSIPPPTACAAMHISTGEQGAFDGGVATSRLGRLLNVVEGLDHPFSGGAPGLVQGRSDRSGIGCL
jgi:hypothetical protein